jgi:hypothetical protein
MRRVKAFWTTDGSEKLADDINQWIMSNANVNPINVSFSRTDNKYGALVLFEIEEPPKNI